MQGRYEEIKLLANDVLYPFDAFEQEVVGEQMMVDAHYHEYLEILYCVEGSFFVLLDGRGYTFGEGDMVVINSMEMHYVLSTSQQKNRYIVIRFNYDLLYTTTQTIFEAKYVLPFTMKTSTHQKVFAADQINATSIPSLIKTILGENQQKEYGFELAIRTCLGEIFLWILRSWYHKGTDLNIGAGLNADTIHRLELVFKYVDENYCEIIELETMAKLCNMSYSYFSRFFKNAMNRNFSSYVNLVRVSKAEHLLATTSESITNIAYGVGFSTSSYFIEQFKHFKNTTPKRFRKLFSQDRPD